MIVKISIKDPDSFIYKAIWEQKEEWRAKYKKIHTEDEKTIFVVEGKDVNSVRSLTNYIFRFLRAYEKLNSLL